MSSYNLYSEEHRPRPEPVVKLYEPNSGWGRPDRVTTTREYNNFTVDFVHSKSDRVVSHERYKEVTKSRFGSLFHIPEPISVLHPILVKYDRCISDLLDGSTDSSPILRNCKNFSISCNKSRFLFFANWDLIQSMK